MPDEPKKIRVTPAYPPNSDNRLVFLDSDDHKQIIGHDLFDALGQFLYYYGKDLGIEIFIQQDDHKSEEWHKLWE